jgi:hypothetical protein
VWDTREAAEGWTQLRKLRAADKAGSVAGKIVDVLLANVRSAPSSPIGPGSRIGPELRFGMNTGTTPGAAVRAEHACQSPDSRRPPSALALSLA